MKTFKGDAAMSAIEHNKRIARATQAKAIPHGYHGLMPFLAVEDAAEAIEFYTRALGARERMRMPGPDGKIAHAELELRDSLVIVADLLPGATAKPTEDVPGTSCTPPKKLGGTSVAVFLYVEDVDEFVRQAVDAGATVALPVQDRFWGDRFGVIADPFGHEWGISTHTQDLTPEDIRERGERAMTNMS
jgi:PhnB protein